MSWYRPRLNVQLCHSLVLSAAIVTTGLLAYLATLRHVRESSSALALSAVLAAGFVWAAYVPALWFLRGISQVAVLPLAIFAWRFAILLPVLGAANRFSGDERNCFLAALLACYFVALPLESWLLIREAKRVDS